MAGYTVSVCLWKYQVLSPLWRAFQGNEVTIMAREQDKMSDTDRLETTVPLDAHPGDDTAAFPSDSPTMASDAGLDDELLDEDGDNLDLLVDEDLNASASDTDFDKLGTENGGIVEIPMSDLPSQPGGLGSPEMSDLNLPGEVDIEELDENALDLTDLPADARLDRLEE
jgi:hypothetical protein